VTRAILFTLTLALSLEGRGKERVSSPLPSRERVRTSLIAAPVEGEGITRFSLPRGRELE